jgi:hypothetical protein
VLGPSRPGIAPNQGRAGPTRRGVAARARPDLAELAPRGLVELAPPGLATNLAAQAKRLQGAATKVAWPPGPEELEGLEVPQVRPLDQPITRLAGRTGAVPRAPAAGLSARSGARELARCREDFFGGVQDGLG